MKSIHSRINPRAKLFTILFLFILITSTTNTQALSVTVSGDKASPPLADKISATFSQQFVTEDVDTDDYTMVTGAATSTLVMDLPDMHIEAGDGETAVQTGTSYVSLEESTVLGDYASESGTWSDYAFLETTYGSVTESVANQTQVNPALSAGSTDAYVSAQATFSSTSGIVGSQYMHWTADVWNDIDDDGVDDSATVAEEEYVPVTKDTYILIVAKVDASDTDAPVNFFVSIAFYTGATDYTVLFAFNGGSDFSSSDTHTTSYTDGSLVTGVAYSVKTEFREAEGEYVTALVDLADLITDDTDSSPLISGINSVQIGFTANDGYGDGTADTITGYLHNLAVFNSLPAVTDNEPGSGNSIDYNGGTSNTAIGDATYFAKHDILLPYMVSAANNDWTTNIYLEKDISAAELTNRWHMIKIVGTAEITPNRDWELGGQSVINGLLMTTETEDGTDFKQIRDVSLYWTFDQIRGSDSKDFISAGRKATLSGHTFKQTLDENDIFDATKDFELSLISATLGSVDKLDDLESQWKDESTSTIITTDFWSTDPADGSVVEIHYSYYSHESADESDLPEDESNWDLAVGIASDAAENPVARFSFIAVVVGFGYLLMKKMED